MLRARVIPCLLLRRQGLVKTIRFKEPSYVGDPLNAVKIFNDKEVDELILLDIFASRQGTPPDLDYIRQVAEECFMPLCYGGGVDSVDMAKRIVALGVEKIAVNSAALERPALIREIADAIGAQSTVVAIDVRRDWMGRPRVFNAARGKATERSPADYAREVADLGAGEILLNDVDRDGTQKGLDYKSIRVVVDAVDIPVVACGGAADIADIKGAVYEGGASGIAAGSLFVYQGKHRAVLISYPDYALLEREIGHL